MRGSLRKRVRFFGLWSFALSLGLAAVMLAVACGGEAEPQTVIQTVVVEGPGQTVVEKVIETVVVEKIVEGKTVMEVQTLSSRGRSLSPRRLSRRSSSRKSSKARR